MRYRMTYRLTEKERADVFALLAAADAEFIPPLSHRTGTTQQRLQQGTAQTDGLTAYFSQMANQAFVLAAEGGTVCGFLSFIPDYELSVLTPAVRCDYVSTVIVSPEQRGRGITPEMYRRLFRLRPDRATATRTWSTNAAHLHILQKLGFSCVLTLKNDRGEGLDTVYYIRSGTHE